MKKTLAFIGAGNMATAIITGAREYNIRIYDKDKSRYEKFERSVFCADTPDELPIGADYLFLCVKPQNLPEVLPELARLKLDNITVVSIMAGVTIEKISSYLGDIPIVRTMPNTPLMIGQGVTALTRNEKVTDKSFSDICRLFSGMGKVTIVKEEQINPITSATSSAPAYVYLFIKAIADEAQKQGLDQKNLIELVSQMVIGSANMLLQSGKTPEELIRMVKSPGGTTAQALEVFEAEGFCDIIARAMQACTKRAEELAN